MKMFMEIKCDHEDSLLLSQKSFFGSFPKPVQTSPSYSLAFPIIKYYPPIKAFVSHVASFLEISHHYCMCFFFYFLVRSTRPAYNILIYLIT